MSWKFVFNTNHMTGFIYLYRALCLARESGFKFMLWEGNVLDCKTSEPIGIKKMNCFKI
jgi:hypothetical protein